MYSNRKMFPKSWMVLAMAALPLLARGVEPGQVAPAFELPGQEGAVRLGDYAGNTVYLDFWASWCAPCKESFPWMNEMQARYGGKGLRIVGVNVDQKIAAAQAFLQRTPAQFKLVFDAAGKVPRSYDIKAMPTSVLIGPDGRVLAVHRGFRSDERAELERQIKLALGER